MELVDEYDKKTQTRFTRAQADRPLSIDIVKRGSGLLVIVLGMKSNLMRYTMGNLIWRCQPQQAELYSGHDKLYPITAPHLPGSIERSGDTHRFYAWMRNYCPLYGILVGPLQDRKTELLKRATKRQSKQKRRTWATTVAFAHQLKKERAAFEAIKQALLNNTKIAFCSPVRQLFAGSDASADGLGVEVYHVE
ncbi:hypothetical protein AAE478_003915 [Parahypoxylon ruwenzoriense]